MLTLLLVHLIHYKIFNVYPPHTCYDNLMTVLGIKLSLVIF